MKWIDTAIFPSPWNYTIWAAFEISVRLKFELKIFVLWIINQMISSGWIIEPAMKDKKLYSMVTYITQVRSENIENNKLLTTAPRTYRIITRNPIFKQDKEKKFTVNRLLVSFRMYD